jgi:hypothetical protein
MTAVQKSVSGALGVNYDERVAGTGTSSNEGNQFALGAMDRANDGSLWMYVHAGGAITLYDWVAIDENFEAVAGTTALAQAGHQVGFAQAAFADDEFGWVCLRGSNIRCRAAAACAPDIALFTSATAGVLDDDSTTTREGIVGVVAVATATATGPNNGHVEVIATWPKAVSP